MNAKIFEPISAETERLAKQTVDAAFRIHSTLGPGLLESVYEVCMIHELTRRGLKIRRQIEIPVMYDGVRLDTALKLDLLVEERLAVELKAVEKINPVFEAQLMTYMRLGGWRLGLLINFTVPLIKDGIKRVIL
jgi:GxxExxY protein